MLERLKEIIVSSQEMPLSAGIPRRLNTPVVGGKASVYIGVRRSGKSTYMFQAMRALLDSGVSPRNILYVNFFDDRLRDVVRGGPSPVLDAFYGLYPELQGTETCHFFFDEIQDTPGWEAFVDRVMRTEKCQVHITGSSAAMLSREIATQMRGRSLSWEVFPFSFREYLDFRGIDGAGPFSTRGRLTVQKAFDDFMVCGGFPEVLGLDPFLMTKIHQEYFASILHRDIIERHDLAHPRMLSDLARRLVDNVGSMYSQNSLTGYLKSLGHKAYKSIVADYLAWLEDTYFTYSVAIHDASLSRVNANPRKLYAVDHALVRSVGSGLLVNKGHLLENMVFISLRRLWPQISYYRSRTGRETDFLVTRHGQSPLLVQVCETMADPATRHREMSALADAMAETGIREATVVTSGEDNEVRLAEGVVHIVPAWRWLLDLPDYPVTPG